MFWKDKVTKLKCVFFSSDKWRVCKEERRKSCSWRFCWDIGQQG